MISSLRVYDIVAQALQRCNALAYGEQIDADLARTAIMQINVLRATAANSYGNVRYFDETFFAPAGPGVKSVTLGPGGDIAVRPSKIDTCVAIMGQVQRSLYVGSLEEYRARPFVDVVALPSEAYIETGYPLSKLWLYPGLGAGYGLRVTGFAYPADYEAIDDLYADPPEYMDWLIKATAARLAPMLGDDAGRHAGEAQLAKDALDRVGLANRMQSMSHGGGFNFLTGRRR